MTVEDIEGPLPTSEPVRPARPQGKQDPEPMTLPPWWDLDIDGEDDEEWTRW